MAENNNSQFRRELDFKRTRREDNLSCLSSTLAENMREQPKVSKLVYSPRRTSKKVGKSDENSKSKKQLKETKVFLSDEIINRSNKQVLRSFTPSCFADCFSQKSHAISCRAHTFDFIILNIF